MNDKYISLHGSHGYNMGFTALVEELLQGIFGDVKIDPIPYKPQLVATFLTLPLITLSYVTKVDKHFNTVHGQCGFVFSILASFQGPWRFCASAYQHRLGYVGNPMAMWRLRKMHRALARPCSYFLRTNRSRY